MRFTTKRLKLREFGEEDFLRFFSVFSNEQIMQFALMDRYDLEDDARPYFHQILRNNAMAAERSAYEWAVFLLSTGEFIGFADLVIHCQNQSGGSGEIGYFLLPSFWGNGYALEIGNALIDFGFREIKLHRIEASCNANNHGSEKIMRRIGMIKEGELRKIRFKDGKWENEMRYSILKEDWRNNDTMSQNR